MVSGYVGGWFQGWWVCVDFVAPHTNLWRFCGEFGQKNSGFSTKKFCGDFVENFVEILWRFRNIRDFLKFYEYFVKN